MRCLLLYATAIALLASCDRAPTAPVSAAGARPIAAVGGNSEKDPLDFGFFVFCANGSEGELVQLTGTLNIVTTAVTSADGHQVFRVGVNPQGVSGIGLTTGAAYRGTGITATTFTIGPGETFTYVNNFRIIGEGLAADFSIHLVTHMTVKANGAITVIFERPNEVCRQG